MFSFPQGHSNRYVLIARFRLGIMLMKFFNILKCKFMGGLMVRFKQVRRRVFIEIVMALERGEEVSEVIH